MSLSFGILSFLALLFAFENQEDFEKLVWDRANTTVRRSAHEFLFEHFLKKKVCVYSQNKELLTELVICEKSTPVDKEERVALPDGTYRVIGIFDQLILRGERLGDIKGVSFSTQQQGRSLRLVKKTERELVFQLPSFPLPKNEMPEIELNIFCEGKKAVIDVVALGALAGINPDFDTHQKTKVTSESKKGKLSINEQFRRSTMDRNFDELAGALSERSAAFNGIIYQSRMTALDVVSINGVLVDRRVSKLYEELSRMDAPEAEEIACANFDREFATFKASWKDTTLIPERMKYAVEAHLFLCAEFSSAAKTLEKIDQWNAWHSDLAPKRGFGFRQSAKLDVIYSMNLQAMMIMRKRDMSVDQLNAWLAVNLGAIMSEGGNPPVVLKQRVLPTSDWTGKQSDILTYVPVIDESGALVNPKKQIPVLQVLRRELLNKNHN